MSVELERAEVVIVGVTYAGDRVCVGALDEDGRTYRLHEGDREFMPANHPPTIGERWVITYVAAPDEPPHLEDVHVHELQKKSSVDAPRFIAAHGRVHEGRLEHLFLGALVPDPKSNRGKLCLEPGKVPGFSVQFCSLDRQLRLIQDANSTFNYCSTAPELPFAVKYVGVRRPTPAMLETGTLVRFSLAKWWKPSDSHDDVPKACSLQLSGWFEC